MQELFFRFTFESFGRIGFGVEFGAIKSKERVTFAAEFDRTQVTLAMRFLNPFWRYTEPMENFARLSNRLAQDISSMEHRVKQIIDERRLDPTRHEKGDLLSLFMDTEDEAGNLPDETAMRDVVLNFMIAGRDTTAQALSWAFYNLARHPRVEQKLYEEVKDLHEITDHKELFETVRNLPYANAVWNEVLRLHPSVPINVKMVIEDDVLPDGTRLTPGMALGWSSWSMGRLEALWGPTAKMFDPDRWLAPDFQKPTAAKWPAFHVGPRTCLGQTMATLEGVTTMSLLLNKFKFALHNDDGLEKMYLVSMTLPMKDPLLMTVARR